VKKFKISVNGKQYEVDVEEIALDGPVTKSKSVNNSSETKSEPSKKQIAETSGTMGSEKITAPMPGTILQTNFEVGDEVKSGEVLCVLEAMKMENDISSPRDGKIASVNISKGDSVNAGDVLLSLE